MGDIVRLDGRPARVRRDIDGIPIAIQPRRWRLAKVIDIALVAIGVVVTIAVIAIIVCLAVALGLAAYVAWRLAS